MNCFCLVVGLSPDGAGLEMQIYGGKCTDQSVMDKLKQDFLKTLKNDLILNYLFCATHAQNCAIENIQVYCSKRKRRSADGSQSNQMIVKFAFAVREKHLASKDTPDMVKLKALSMNLEKEKSSILQKVNKATCLFIHEVVAS